MPKPTLRRRALLGLYVAAIVALATSAIRLIGGPFSTITLTVPMVVVAVALVVCERLKLDVPFGRETHTITSAEAVLVAAALTVDGIDVLLGAAVAGIGVYVMWLRLPPMKAAFNVAVLILEASVPVSLVMVATSSSDAIAYPLAIGGAVLGGAITTFAVGGAIKLSGGEYQPVQALASSAVTTICSAAIGVQMVALARVSPWLLPIGAVPLLVAVLTLRLFIEQRRHRRRSQFLYQATLAMHGAPDIETALDAVLKNARSGLDAALAYLVIHDDEQPWLIASGSPNDGRIRELNGSVRHSVSTMLASDSGTVVIGTASTDLDALAAELGFVGDVIVARLSSGDASGLLVVGDPLAQRAEFDSDERVVVQDLADHIAVAVSNAAVSASLGRLREADQRLSYEANHDPLTGLVNRRKFGQALEDLSTSDGGAVVMIDLDDFKRLNDSIGHMHADAVLVEFAQRLQRCIGPNDVAARLGGDEFAVVLTDISNESELDAATQRIRSVFLVEFDTDVRSVGLAGSMGASLVTGAGDKKALHRADLALYHAKSSGKNQTSYHRRWMAETERQRARIADGFTTALHNGSITLEYQPVVELASGRMLGAEALMRWNDADYGAISPVDFFPVLEQAGHANLLAAWTFDQAVDVLAAQQVRDPGFFVNVNVSPLQLLWAGLIDHLSGLITATGIEPSTLRIEISETGIIENVDEVELILRRLAGLGVGLVLDHFGTGFSSLAHLGRFPIDAIKIDRSFVEEICTSRSAEALIRATIALANDLDVAVVGEGIEECDQRDKLSELGCPTGQGYLYAPALPPLELAGFGASSGPGQTSLRLVGLTS